MLNGFQVSWLLPDSLLPVRLGFGMPVQAVQSCSNIRDSFDMATRDIWLVIPNSKHQSKGGGGRNLLGLQSHNSGEPFKRLLIVLKSVMQTASE